MDSPKSPGQQPVAGSALLEAKGLDDLLLYRLNGLQAQGTGMVRKLCEGRWGITHREWRIIAILADNGSLAPSELALRARLDRPRTSRAIASLQRKSLLSRQPRTNDGKLVDVRLTSQGQALHGEVFQEVRRINLALLDALVPEDVGRLEVMLELVTARARQLAQTLELPLANRRKGGSRMLSG